MTAGSSWGESSVEVIEGRTLQIWHRFPHIFCPTKLSYKILILHPTSKRMPSYNEKKTIQCMVVPFLKTQVVSEGENYEWSCLKKWFRILNMLWFWLLFVLIYTMIWFFYKCCLPYFVFNHLYAACFVNWVIYKSFKLIAFEIFVNKYGHGKMGYFCLWDWR